MLTHTELNQRAVKWLISQGCSVVISEVKCWNDTGEIADALGFNPTRSVLVESKASRADFLADRNKRFRQNPALGVGQWRFYLCEKGIIKPEDLPPKWGLLYIAGSTIKKIVYPHEQNDRGNFTHDHNMQSERAMLISVARRLGVYDRSVAGKIFFKETFLSFQQSSNP